MPLVCSHAECTSLIGFQISEITFPLRITVHFSHPILSPINNEEQHLATFSISHHPSEFKTLSNLLQCNSFKR